MAPAGHGSPESGSGSRRWTKKFRNTGGDPLKLHRFILALLFIAIFSHNANAEPEGESMLAGFSAGLGGTILTNEYKEMDGRQTILPLLGYEGDYFYLRGVAGGFHFFKNEFLELNAQLSYLPQHFYAGDSDSWAMRQLDNRYSTLMGGFNGRLMTEFGILNATFETDLLGYNNGIRIDASYVYPIQLGMVSLAPGVGFQWTDANYNRYYYGVDHSEARDTGLEYYDPDSSFSPYVQLGARINFNENWSVMGSCRALFLNQEIYDSPMVDCSEKYAFSLGAMYSF